MLDVSTAPDGRIQARPAETISGRWDWLTRLPLPAAISLAFLVLVVVVAIAAPVLPIDNPNATDFTQRLHEPFTSGHLLGTDDLGRDMFSRIIWGSRIALLSGFVPVIAGSLIGGALGVVAGMSPRPVRATIMRILDVFLAFPALLLAIVVAASLGAGLETIIISITVIVIPPLARIADVETNRLRSTEFVVVARGSGARTSAVVARHIVPNVAPTLLVYSTSLVGLAIVYSAGLSLLGLGIAAPTADWGAMVTELRTEIFTTPVLATVPAIAIFLVSMAFNVLGDGLRDVLAIGRR